LRRSGPGIDPPQVDSSGMANPVTTLSSFCDLFRKMRIA
jgi:hypothetical protein